jgi:hypothetical protein
MNDHHLLDFMSQMSESRQNREEARTSRKQSQKMIAAIQKVIEDSKRLLAKQGKK